MFVCLCVFVDDGDFGEYIDNIQILTGAEVNTEKFCRRVV